MADSVFKVKPKNILGLEAQSFKSKLLALALSEPSVYFGLRDRVYAAIVENAVANAYELYWTILTEGKVGTEQITNVTKDSTTPKPFAPK